MTSEGQQLCGQQAGQVGHWVPRVHLLQLLFGPLDGLEGIDVVDQGVCATVHVHTGLVLEPVVGD